DVGDDRPGQERQARDQRVGPQRLRACRVQHRPPGRIERGHVAVEAGSEQHERQDTPQHVLIIARSYACAPPCVTENPGMVALGQRGARLHGRLALGGTGLRDIDVGMAPPAHGRYTRAWLGLGPVVRFRPGRFLLDLDALASVALLYVSGIGYASSRSATDVDV